MTIPTTTKEPAIKRYNNIYNGIKALFPGFNEDTWNYVIPVMGLALSSFTFTMTLALFQRRWEREVSQMYNLGHFTLACAVAIDLYYGLIYNKKSKFGFWLLTKLVEMVLLITASMLLCYTYYYRYMDYLAAPIILLVFNALLYYCVICKLRNIPEEPVETLIGDKNVIIA